MNGVLSGLFPHRRHGPLNLPSGPGKGRALRIMRLQPHPRARRSCQGGGDALDAEADRTNQNPKTFLSDKPLKVARRTGDGMAVLTLYNTLTRKKEEFTPLHPPKVGFYSCGPTVYHDAHIGNLRAFVFADTLKRILRADGYRVFHVINITDVGHLTDDGDDGEDKMEKGARREGKSVWEIARHYTDAFLHDIHALNVEDPDIWSKATDHITEQIAQIQAIEKKGFTYRTEDGIYFDTTKLKDYGKLAKLNIEQLEAGARVEVGEKRHKTDFALWKFSPKNQKRAMEWPSPWGIGFPGWHIECSAMSSKYLGEQFDIHTGGADLIPVHHTNEIAQAECAYGKKPWVKYWLHNEFLVNEKGKMAKSAGDFLTLQSLIDKGYPALAYRYFLLTGHYRQQLQFSWGALDSAKQSLERLKNIVEELRGSDGTSAAAVAATLGWSGSAKKRADAGRDAPTGEHEARRGPGSVPLPRTSGKDPHHQGMRAESGAGRGGREALRKDDRSAKHESAFLDAINDDLNTPQALAVLWSALRDNELNTGEKLALVGRFDAVLGLSLLEREEEKVPADITALAGEREAARKAKDWKRSDELRAAIHAKGYDILDGKEGYRIKRK